MPTYDYLCEDCGYSFEYFQTIKENPLTECPECKGKVKRKIGPGLGPIFKGTGFYQTDYKGNTSKSSDTNQKSSTKESTKIDSGTSSSTESSKKTD